MPDNRSHLGERDRNRVAGPDRHEVERFASRHGISTEEARDLIERHGGNRAALERDAQSLRRH